MVTLLADFLVVQSHDLLGASVDTEPAAFTEVLVHDDLSHTNAPSLIARLPDANCLIVFGRESVVA
jgi:hypothetical protein